MTERIIACAVAAAIFMYGYMRGRTVWRNDGS